MCNSVINVRFKSCQQDLSSASIGFTEEEIDCDNDWHQTHTPQLSVLLQIKKTPAAAAAALQNGNVHDNDEEKQNPGRTQ